MVLDGFNLFKQGYGVLLRHQQLVLLNNFVLETQLDFILALQLEK